MTSDIDTTTTAIDSALGRIFDAGDQVFSAPQQVGDRILITAAVVQRAGGFGFGGGEGSTDGETGGGSGGGGGGSSSVRPVAVIEAGPDGLVVRPILDVTKILVVALTTLLAMRRLARRR